MRGFCAPVTLAAGMFAGILALSPTSACAKGQDQSARLEIEVGEPIGDVMARSTRRYDFPIRLDMQSILLQPGRDGGQPLQIVLRNGTGQSATLPYEPFDGMLWMQVGVTDELDLRFVQFPSPASPATPDDAAIEGIVAIYESIMPLTLRPRGQISCYHNNLEISRQPCDRVTLATERLTADALRERLRAFQALAASEDYDGGLLARTLNLGQWWLPNGGSAMLVVTAAAEAEGAPIRLSFGLNIRDFFNSRLSRLMLACYDQQALFPEKMLYTQEQAARIFHGLRADFFPPVVDGVVVTDRIRLAELDWTELSDHYWNDPDARAGFCDLLRELEEEVGYSGPVAPRR